MNCKQMEIQIIPFLDGRLSRPDAAAVQTHLANCAACAGRLRGFSEIGSLMDGWEPVTPSASFDLRLQQRILAEPARQSGWMDQLFFWLRLNPIGKPALAGAILGIMALAIALTNFYPGTTVSLSSGIDETALVAGNDELALYQEMIVLENLELLRNFEVLQELQTTNQ